MLLALFLIHCTQGTPSGAENENKFGSLQGQEKAEVDGVNAFRVFDCAGFNTELATAQYSLNKPQACVKNDGSAFIVPVDRKAHILQRIEKVPVCVTNCWVSCMELHALVS